MQLRRIGKALAGVGTLAGGGLYLYSNQHLLRVGSPVDSALQPGQSLTCELRGIERLSDDTARFRFGPCAFFATSLSIPACDGTVALRLLLSRQASRVRSTFSDCEPLHTSSL
jgi:hypothetical protein